MVSARLRANLIYLTILAAIIYGIHNAITDKIYPTGNTIPAIVHSISPIYSRHSLKVIVTIKSGNNIQISRTVNVNAGFRVGQKVELKEYTSTKNGDKKYKIIR